MGSIVARLALLAAVAAAVLVFGAGPAYRFGYVDLMSAFGSMRFGVYAAAGAGVLAVLGLVLSFLGRGGSRGLLFASLVLAGAAAAVPISMMQIGASVPPIHDITTDTTRVPEFVAIAPLRADAPNGLAYNAEENAAAQQKAYPDIQPLVMPDVPPGDLFARAEVAAKSLGWAIVASVPDEGRLEATDTTLWFGFKDDIIVRIEAEGSGSRMDVRSMSRVGKSDLGKNADRIRAFIAKVKEAK